MRLHVSKINLSSKSYHRRHDLQTQTIRAVTRSIIEREKKISNSKVQRIESMISNLTA